MALIVALRTNLSIADDLVGQSGGEEFCDDLAGQGNHFDNVSRNDAFALGDGPQERRDLVPIQSARFGCAGAGGKSRIEGVDVECDVHVLSQTIHRTINPIPG